MSNEPLACPKCASGAPRTAANSSNGGRIRIALAGNPNSGKSTVFNLLTGSRQHTGNWPGKTIQKKEGVISYAESEIELVDLPGTYSLSAYSAEEVVARDFILRERPDAVIVIVDAANLERNLYLVVQILELAVPAVIALNMSDLAENRRIQTDVGRLSQSLGVPVIRTNATTGDGINEVIETILGIVKKETA